MNRRADYISIATGIMFLILLLTLFAKPAKGAVGVRVEAAVAASVSPDRLPAELMGSPIYGTESLLPEPGESPSCTAPTTPPAIETCTEAMDGLLIPGTLWGCIHPRGMTGDWEEGQYVRFAGYKLQWHGPKPPSPDCNASTAWQPRCGYRCLPGREVLPHRSYSWGRPAQVTR